MDRQHTLPDAEYIEDLERRLEFFRPDRRAVRAGFGILAFVWLIDLLEWIGGFTAMSTDLSLCLALLGTMLATMGIAMKLEFKRREQREEEGCRTTKSKP